MFRINRVEKVMRGRHNITCIADDILTFEEAAVKLMQDCRKDEQTFNGNGNWTTKLKGAYLIQAPGHELLAAEEIEMY